MTPKESYNALALNLRIVGEVQWADQLSGTAAGTAQRVELPAILLRQAIRAARTYEGSDLLAAAAEVEANLAPIAQMMFPVHDSETNKVASYLHLG